MLTRLRENGESIALISGEKEERAGVDRALGKVLRAWRAICTQYMRTTFVSHGIRLHRAGAADHPVRAEIPRRLDDARRK